MPSVALTSVFFAFVLTTTVPCVYTATAIRVPLTSISVEWCVPGQLGCAPPTKNRLRPRVPAEGIVIRTNDVSSNVGATDLYIAGLAFGNPPQYFNLTLNSDSYWTTLFDKYIQQNSGCANRGVRRLFDYSRSTTFRRGKKSLFTDVDLFASDPYCDSGPLARGLGFGYYRAFSTIVRDDVRIRVNGSNVLTAQKMPFALATNFTNVLSKFWPSDGILGLQFGNYKETEPSMIHGLAAAAQGSQVTFRFDAPAQVYPSMGQLTGTMLIGAQDTEKCEEEWTYFPLGMDIDLIQTNSVPVLTSRIGNFSVGNASAPGIAVLEVRQTAIFVDFTIFPQVMAAVGAQYDKKTSTYVVNCREPHTLPDIVLTLVNQNMYVQYDYHISAKDYVGNIVPRNDGMCTVLIEQLDEQVGCDSSKCSIGCGCGVNWILGTAAARSYCWVYDYDVSFVGIAKAKTP